MNILVQVVVVKYKLHLKDFYENNQVDNSVKKKGFLKNLIGKYKEIKCIKEII